MLKRGQTKVVGQYRIVCMSEGGGCAIYSKYNRPQGLANALRICTYTEAIAWVTKKGN